MYFRKCISEERPHSSKKHHKEVGIPNLVVEILLKREQTSSAQSKGGHGSAETNQMVKIQCAHFLQSLQLLIFLNREINNDSVLFHCF